MSWVRPVPGGFQVILDGKKGLGLQGDAPEFLSFTEEIKSLLAEVNPRISKKMLGSTIRTLKILEMSPKSSFSRNLWG